MLRARLIGVKVVVTALACAGGGACVDIIDHGKTPCVPETCDGCCTANGVCLPGSNVFACGAGAGLCRTCRPEEICAGGVCRVPGAYEEPPPDGGGPDACGPKSCEGCCANGECVAQAQQTDSYCGEGGSLCHACTGLTSCVDRRCEAHPGCHLTLNLVYPPGYDFAVQDFGQIPVGATARFDLTFRNTGDRPCAITAPTFLPGTDVNAFSFNGQSTYPFEVEPGQTSKLAVTFTPYAPNAWDGFGNAFTFTANDGARSECANGQPGCRKVVVRGVGLDTSFTARAPVVPDALDLGEVAVGCQSGWRQVLLVNESKTPMTVSAASVSGAGFELQSPALPVTVAPWATLTLYVRFAPVPTQTGPQAGSLSLVDSTGLARSFPLTATGVSTLLRSESFLQEKSNDADILFVVSNGATMEQPQLDLSSALAPFWTNAMSAGASLHAGVISTDVSLESAGRLLGSPRFVTSSTPNAVDALGSNVRVGTQGAIDQALEAVRLALTPPNGDDPLRNGGFLRTNARLGLVIVTDSAEKSGAPVDDYVRILRELVRGPLHDRVRSYPIAPATQCQSSGRYLELVDRTGGLCQARGAAPMTAQLLAIAGDLFRPRDEYELTYPIDLAQPVIVLVDASPADPTTQYLLDPAHNSLRFSTNSVPEPGQTISVTYSTLCHP
ncbi:MAG: choice-of-anchor D domain-containing protein [Myxococcaceae bacterium]|nr:choice-of-anchor D domain-containing protein [Myxococcaceae bacterium]